jgi:hypothetical protein
LLFQIFEIIFIITRTTTGAKRQNVVNHNYKAMTKGLITKKDKKKEATKSLKEKRKEKKEKKNAK